MNSKTQVQIINDELNLQLAHDGTKRALLATTFKGLTETTMRQAMLEGMLTGFTFENFLKKDVYALPFNGRNGPSYSLITSIGYARKIGQKAGQCGKKAPVYTFINDGEIETCSVTVQKKVGDYIGDYTATVYFREYNTGKNLWIAKPLSMISKVAEMHALRSAFPEELDKIYVEEEFEKGTRINEVKDMVENNNLTMGDALVKDDETKITNKKIKKQDEDEDDLQISFTTGN